MPYPHTTRRTEPLIDGTSLEYYWVRDGNGGGCQNYSHKDAAGNLIKMYFLEGAGWSKELNGLLDMRLYTTMTNRGVELLANVDYIAGIPRGARRFDTKEEAQAILDILGEGWCIYQWAKPFLIGKTQ